MDLEVRLSKKAIVILSGGLDSAVTLYKAHADGYDVDALTFRYGQRHVKEIMCAAALCEHLGIPDPKVFEFNLASLVSTALTGQEEIPTEGLSKDIPVTWVPQRNTIFLALAFAYAETIHAEAVYAGFNAVDYSGYPDCRPEFVLAAETTLNLASKRFVTTGEVIRLKAPLIKMSKKDIVLLGTKLGVPFGLTWSCYKGKEEACGVCDSCRIRLKAFADAGLKDPVRYGE